MSPESREVLARNPGARRGPVGLAATREPLDFHRRLPGYAPTPLVDTPEIAAALDVGRVLVKVESNRFGLPAFKVLGASWATYQVLVGRLGREPRGRPCPSSRRNSIRCNRSHWSPPPTATTAAPSRRWRAPRVRRAHLRPRRHGRRHASPASRAKAPGRDRRRRLRRRGGAARRPRPADRHVVISDTAWPGYREPPRRVMEGYSTIFFEIEDALARTDVPRPTIVFTPAGVGTLAAATVAYMRGTAQSGTVVSVEPEDAACVLHSCVAACTDAGAGPAPLDDGRAELRQRLPRCVARARARARLVCRRSRIRMPSTPSTSWPAAASRAARRARHRSPVRGRSLEHGDRAAVGLDHDATVLVICTEGVTDPLNYEAVVGRAPETVGPIDPARVVGAPVVA